MKKIDLICIGYLKFKGLKELEKKYIKNLNYFVEFSVKNLRPARWNDETKVDKKEGDMIKKQLMGKDLVIALDRKGIKMNSHEFAEFLEDRVSYHPGRIVFLIGGESGLSAALDQRIDKKISFSDMTFPHDLFRILFLEQLYRAFTILKGIKYHR